MITNKNKYQMKKYHFKTGFALLLFILAAGCCTITNAQYTIKNRWNTKITYSENKTKLTYDFRIRNSASFRVALNYGVINCLEVGVYSGFTLYYAFIYSESSPTNFIKEKAFAPTFGTNVNFHILPLFVKKEKCRWEWYITAKYGGAYFAKYGGEKYASFYIGDISNGNEDRYRHEYGLGMGGGVYFWNTFGFTLEVCGGQYSYFPEHIKEWYSIRGGIQFKFTPKPKRKLE